MTQSDDEQPTIERGALVSDGRENWTVECTDGPAVPDGEVMLERYDRVKQLFDRDQIGQCSCGRLVLGGDQCYGCYKTQDACIVFERGEEK